MQTRQFKQQENGTTVTNNFFFNYINGSREPWLPLQPPVPPKGRRAAACSSSPDFSASSLRGARALPQGPDCAEMSRVFCLWGRALGGLVPSQASVSCPVAPRLPPGSLTASVSPWRMLLSRKPPSSFPASPRTRKATDPHEAGPASQPPQETVSTPMPHVSQRRAWATRV